MPVYLNFKQLHLYKHQRKIYLQLYWTNGVALFIILLDISITTFLDGYDFVWLTFLPLLVQVVVLSFAMIQIQRELKIIGLQDHYMSGYLILIHLAVWLGMCVVISVWLISYIFTYRQYLEGKEQGTFALYMYRIVQIVIVLMKFSFAILLLFMFIQFSRPHIFEQFDKMCKKKFLDYLDGIYDDDEAAQTAIKLNLSRYLLRLEAQARKEMKIQNITLADTTENSMRAS